MRWGLFAGLLVVSLVFTTGCGTEEAGDTEAGESARTMPAPVPSVQSNEIQMEAPPPEPDPESVADLAELRAAVERNPSDYAAQRELAIALFRANLRDQAVIHFERAAELNSGVQAQIDLANAYGFASRLDDAEVAYRRVLEIDPNHVTTLYNLGNAIFMRAEIERSIEYYDRAIALEPDYLLAHYHRGLALKMLLRFREAYTAFGAVMNLEPTNGEELKAFDGSLYEMAALDIAMGALPRAEEMLQALLKASPEHPNAHYMYGQLLLRQGRVEEAQAQLEIHMKVSSDVKTTGPVSTAH